MLRLLAAFATFLVAAAAEGCARSSAEPAGRRAPEAPATAVAARPPILDQGEEITPEELETIPEPVPASPGGAGGFTPRTAAKAAQEAPQTGSGATGPDPAAGIPKPGPAAGTARWSVQVLATQDRDLLDRH